MDLQTLANLAQILGAVAVVAAIAFGLVQMGQFRLKRRDAAAAELVRSFQDSSFTRSFRLVAALPRNATAAELRAGGPAVEEAALAIGMRYEALGLLVFRDIMPLSLVADLVGGVSLELWSKMEGVDGCGARRTIARTFSRMVPVAGGAAGAARPCPAAARLRQISRLAPAV